MLREGAAAIESGRSLEDGDVGGLADLAGSIAARLIARGETLAVAESSAGGLISAALLAVPGASAYFIGGVVVYTATARQSFLGIDQASMGGTRSSTEAYAAMLARAVRERLTADWAVAETGAAGPAGNRYGDFAGHVCLAVSGPVEKALTLDTGTTDRAGNMRSFARTALSILDDALRDVHSSATDRRQHGGAMDSAPGAS